MTGTTEECWMHFKELLHSLIADHVPLKVLNSKRVAKKPVWMTHKAFKQVVKKERFTVNIKMLIIQQLKQHVKQPSPNYVHHGKILKRDWRTISNMI